MATAPPEKNFPSPATSRETVTVLGLGAMGTAMAEAYLAAGHPTVVWNRTAAKAAPLVAKGATRAESPAEAVAAGDVVVLSLLDYAAMYQILDDSVPLDGRVLVNLSSDTPERLRAAARWAEERGGRLLTGGIMVPPPAVATPGAYTFYSGPEELLRRHEETLRVLSDTTYVGADPGLSMQYYQAMLFLMWTSLAGYYGATALLGTAGVSAEDFVRYPVALFAEMAQEGPLGIPALAREIDAGHFPGDANSLHMQVVGAAHVVDTFRDAGLDTGMATAVHALLAATEAAGYGADGLGRIIERFRRPRPAAPPAG